MRLTHVREEVSGESVTHPLFVTPSYPMDSLFEILEVSPI